MYALNVDFLITAYDRPKCLSNLLRSIVEWNGGNKLVEHRILIGDQSKEPQINEFLEWESEDAAGNTSHHVHPFILPATYQLPHDCGLSFARNALVDLSDAKYVLLLEDDFEFTDKTRIGKLYEAMEALPDDVGILGGRVVRDGQPIDFQFDLEVRDGVLYQIPSDGEYKFVEGIKVKETGCVMNFALMRREMFDDIKWDPELKLREHHDFFLRLKETKWRVFFTPDVEINDAKPKKQSDEYKALKSRDEFMVKMMEKNGINAIQYLNGFTLALRDGKIFKEHRKPIV